MSTGAWYRQQRELEEGGKRLAESAGYGGASVYEAPKKRARRQIEGFEEETCRDERSDLASMGLDAGKLKELRSQYGNESMGGLARLDDITPSHRKRSMTRCVPHRDCGLTEASAEGCRLFCLDFARGKCPDGGACTHRHEVPRSCDDDDGEVLNRTYDIFGRKRALLLSAWERHHGKKEEGSLDTCLKALHVSGLRAPPKKRSELCGGARGSGGRSVAGDLDAAVRRAFSAFGEVIETRVVLDSTKGHWAIVTYSSRAAAEFAKEAMTGQGLRVDGGEIIQVRWAKPETATSAAAGYVHVDASSRPVPLKPPTMTARPPKAAAVSAPPPNAAAAALPKGWAATLDAASQRVYYHHVSGAVQWEAPASAEAPLPAGWDLVRDDDAGVVYYHNAARNETTWDRPTR